MGRVGGVPAEPARQDRVRWIENTGDRGGATTWVAGR